jgi:hypothetical protein
MENNMTNKEASQLNTAKAEIKILWQAACLEAGVPADSKFVVFENTPAADAHNQAMLEFQKLRNRIVKNSNRRERHATLKGLGLNRVKGAQGGVYYE